MAHLGALRSLSSLLRAAVHDAQEVEKLDGHRLNMGVWHLPIRSDKVCEVCLAGSVMVRRLGVSDWRKESSPYHFPDRTEDKLIAIDEMRIGDFITAYELIWPLGAYYRRTISEERAMLRARSIVLDDRNEPAHGRASWETYLRAADVLQAAGL